MQHPFIADLSDKSLDDLSETISKLSNNLQFAYKTGKHDMVRQMQMVLESYRGEYNRRMQEQWNKKSQSLDKKIDIK